ncbi:hypothetical protein J4233_01710 [Candidatus Pacearchaeota archaeon]|nr:hypothetical protein [Candidatus Pacearchaeota archaeon]
MAFGSIADILFQWESIGFFDFVLPFLLIFSIVFGVLSYIGVFGKNKGINAVIAVILGLLSIRAGFFQAFLAEIAPRLGVGITVLLVILILVGLFVQDQSKKVIGWVLLGIAAVIFIIILGQMYTIFGEFGNGLGFDNPDTIGWIIMLGLLITLIVVVAVGNADKTSKHTGDFVKMYKE